jgi:hypothetical protein
MALVRSSTKERFHIVMISYGEMAAGGESV